MAIQNTHKYFAFISYNSRDTRWGWRLQRKLESFRLPAALCRDGNRRPIRRVFFAPTEIQPGGLSEELQNRLRDSKYLIVICSPNSARSQWVGREIEYFASLGREKDIYFFIVGGTPHSGGPDECFNPVIDRLGLPEILGVNVHEKVYNRPWLNRERAYTQLISKLLGLDFDQLWQRQKRRALRRRIAWCAATVAVAAIAAGAWYMNRPFDTRIALYEKPSAELPATPWRAVSLILDNETKTDTIAADASEVCFANIPHSMLGKEARITIDAPGYIAVDTTIAVDRDIKLAYSRDPAVYGHIAITLVDASTRMPLPGLSVNVAGTGATADSDGLLSLDIPLEAQATEYTLTVDGSGTSYTIYMPCGPADILSVDIN